MIIKNTLDTINFAKKAREIYFKIADEEGIEFELLKKGILRFYDNAKEFKLDKEKFHGFIKRVWSGRY